MRGVWRKLLNSGITGKCINIQHLAFRPIRIVLFKYLNSYVVLDKKIGQILKKNVNTVYTLLTRAKQALRETLGGDDDA